MRRTPKEHQEAIPSGLVDSPVKGLQKFVSIGPRDKAEHAHLVVRQLHARKIELRCWVCGGGAIFSVGKKDSDKLHEIWDGSREAFATPTSAHFFVALGTSAWSAASIHQQ